MDRKVERKDQELADVKQQLADITKLIEDFQGERAGTKPAQDVEEEIVEESEAREEDAQSVESLLLEDQKRNNGHKGEEV